jgi:hypothetical protein
VKDVREAHRDIKGRLTLHTHYLHIHIDRLVTTGTSIERVALYSVRTKSFQICEQSEWKA